MTPADLVTGLLARHPRWPLTPNALAHQGAILGKSRLATLRLAHKAARLGLLRVEGEGHRALFSLAPMPVGGRR
jgi:hypothetical protein